MHAKSPSQRILSPLALASYVAWSAVWYSNSRLFGASLGPGWWADALLLAFLVAWVWFLWSEEEGRWTWQSVVQMLVLSGSLIGLLALGRSGSSPILMILVVSLFVTRFSWTWARILLLALNAVYFVLLLTVWNLSLSSAIVSLAAYGAFQAFALLVLRYAAESEEMADELRRVNADLMATRHLLDQSARDQERLRLSRELHDVAGHKLTALRMNLRALRQQGEVGHRDRLEAADALAGELLDDLRAVVRQLRISDGLSLEEGFRQLAAPLSGLSLELEIEPEVKVDRVGDAETLMRVVQEGLTNAARHGRARHVWLHLARDGDRWRLGLDDDGQLKWPIRPGLGLKGMRERLELLGGGLSLEPSSRGGLHLSAWLPVSIAP
ncbi:sensor histidine kinase [Wenzhouxiangella marina]|uniref:Signal transduction histidine kinase n=1 Tax=Wenzhouxiangella marina TaxID=1579979 RepID=A0A0K0XWC8_9GAMM|nr:histidine kinase [Wenzhouxiangella marina]AKS42009.1 Signal transduction histidine kinase [Wenzhouxiangella marina]MBB6086223.1 signal transduction histidine kinase [Wenzhouxiangella marina]